MRLGCGKKLLYSAMGLSASAVSLAGSSGLDLVIVFLKITPQTLGEQPGFRMSTCPGKPGQAGLVVWSGRSSSRGSQIHIKNGLVGKEGRFS